MSDEKSKKSDVVTPGEFLKNDVLGVSDWKTSKIGYISGFSNFRRMSQGFTSTFTGTTNRLRILLSSLFFRENVQDMERFSDDPTARFRDAQLFYGQTEDGLKEMQNSTHRSALFFLFLTIVGVSWAVISLFIWPATSWLHLFARAGATPLTMALFLKSSYTNYVVRIRSLLTFKEFLLSGEYMTKPTR